ncbi:MAG TPA: glycosyltransferase family 4 protein [Sedimentisphaerales bacterium]|nr:glycosyltransferase family 4 protein [Sedimentisphaerales bacterium]HRS10252.1 glycosyltransferase family 4 protein [Sedimentisphaerales bacterium]HRV46958.1 glycosyltransferase family 4 protein [Sedimentisphaerales bacterium]
MRILYVHNDYASTSGEEHAAESLVNLLRQHGHEVAWFRRSSAGLHRSPIRKAQALLAGIYNPYAARAMETVLDEFRPDIVQVQNLYPLISTSIFRPIRQRHIPVVMRCPNYRLFCPNGRHLVHGRVCNKCAGFGHEIWCVIHNCEGDLFKSLGYAARNTWARLTRRILNGVDVFIVQSQFQRKVFAARGISADRIEVVPGMAPDVSDSPAIGEGVAFVGRISPEKGVETLVEAARVVPDIPFAIAGDDAGLAGLRETSPANVRWHGFLRGEQLADLYRRSRIVVVPSRWYEGFPNVIVQAMMMGRPVICSNIGGLPEIVDAGNTGLLFETDNASDLARKIRYLYERPALCRQMGAAGRAKALREYSTQACYRRLMAAFEKAQQKVDRRQDPCHSHDGRVFRSCPQQERVPRMQGKG